MFLYELTLLLTLGLTIKLSYAHHQYQRHPESKRMINGRTHYQFRQLKTSSHAFGRTMKHGTNHQVAKRGWWASLGLLTGFWLIALGASTSLPTGGHWFLIVTTGLVSGLMFEASAEYGHLTQQPFFTAWPITTYLKISLSLLISYLVFNSYLIWQLVNHP